MGLLRRAFALIMVGFIAQYIVRMIVLMGYHKHIYNHAPGPCHLVDGIVNGSEDIQTMSNGLAIITSGLSVIGKSAFDGREGALYIFDFNDPNAGARKLHIEGGEIENPHGLSIWEDPDSDVATVFVVNHASDGERIEKLEFDKTKRSMKHVKSISDSSIGWPNDIVATGPETFYFTNSFASPKLFMQYMEILTISRSSLVYYDGKQGRRAVEGVRILNGINISPDGRFVYTVSVLDEALLIFHRKADNSLELKESVALHTHPDNIDVLKDTGELWIGNHPIFHKIMKHGDYPSSSTPSQVLRLKMKDGSVTHIEEVYAEDDKMLWGSSVANYHKGTMLVGSVLHKLLYCQVLHLE